MTRPIPEDFIAVTPKIIAEIEEHIYRTGKTALKILWGNLHKCPEDMNAIAIQNIANRRAVKKSHYEAAIALWRATPSLPEYVEVNADQAFTKRSDGRMDITEDMLEKIRQEKQRTGKGISTLLKGKRGEKPAGMHSGHINNMSRHKTMKRAYYEYAVKLYEATPDKPAPKEKKDKPAMIEMAGQRRDELKARIKQSGMSLSELWEVIKPDAPEGITYTYLISLMNTQNKRTRKDFYEYVEKRTQNLKVVRVLIDDTIREQLIELRDISGVNETQLLRDAQNAPQELSASLINSWIKRKGLKAHKDLLDWTVKEWERLLADVS